MPDEHEIIMIIFSVPRLFSYLEKQMFGNVDQETAPDFSLA